MPDDVSGAAWPFRESVAVRYQEVDPQNVVFNAHYLGWCDMAFAGWMRSALGWTGVGDAVDWMLVRAEIEWQGSATYGDTVDIDCGAARWGRSSFDVAYRGMVGAAPVFTALITYVCVVPGTKASTPITDAMRGALAPAPGVDP